jgi:Holliday junction resolvase RusA-like endonuclease
MLKGYIAPIQPYVQKRPVTINLGGRIMTFVPSNKKQKELRLVLKQFFKKPIPAEFKLRLTLLIYRKTLAGDTDNYLKAFEDAANGIIYDDDSQIHDVRAVKLLDREAPRWEFFIEYFTESQSIAEYNDRLINAGNCNLLVK